MRVVYGRRSSFESDLQLINNTNAQVDGRIILNMELSGRRKKTQVPGFSEGQSKMAALT